MVKQKWRNYIHGHCCSPGETLFKSGPGRRGGGGSEGDFTKEMVEEGTTETSLLPGFCSETKTNPIPILLPYKNSRVKTVMQTTVNEAVFFLLPSTFALSGINSNCANILKEPGSA